MSITDEELDKLKEKIKIKQGLTLIYGHNGSGKTRLVNKIIEDLKAQNQTDKMIIPINKQELLDLYSTDLIDKFVIIDAVYSLLNENEFKIFIDFVTKNQNCKFIVTAKNFTNFFINNVDCCFVNIEGKNIIKAPALVGWLARMFTD